MLRRRCALTSSIAAILLWFAMSGIPARSAGPDEGPTLNVLVMSSDLIVVGRIARVTSVERPNDLDDISYNKTSKYTAVIATLEVSETIKGELPASVKVTYPKRPRVSGEPVYDPGQDGIWLLRRSEKKETEFVADEIGRFQKRERKEQIKAILARSKGGGGANDKEKDDGK